jgi:adenylate cyclase
MLNFVLVQVNFWVIANIALIIIINFTILSVRNSYKLDIPVKLAPYLLLAIAVGGLFGLVTGSVEFKLDNNDMFKRKGLGKIIITKSLIAFTVFLLLFLFTRYVLYEWIVVDLFYHGFSPMKEQAWEYLFYLYTVFHFFMIFFISFINQVNKKYGPGVLLPLLFGKYRDPKEEERIFLFMDLKSSTSIAEKLGHIHYSEFIRDGFMDINHVLATYNAEIYQYVGDEIVITWQIEDGLKDLACVNFFFACMDEFNKRKEYYMKKYQCIPEFKAGVHMGKITAVEIGEIKRDIAYHGDTVNTAARIQSLCNVYNKRMLVSEYLSVNSGQKGKYSVEALGKISLKGRREPIGISSIELNVD